MVVAGYHIQSTFHHSRNGLLLLHRIRGRFKMLIFLICSQLMRHPLIKLFHLSNLLPMPNDHRMVLAEFFSNFSCSYEDQLWWLLSLVVVNFQWPATTLLIFKVLISLAKLLEPPLHCMCREGEGGSGRRAYMHNYVLFMLFCSRNQYNIVKQFFSN